VKERREERRRMAEGKGRRSTGASTTKLWYLLFILPFLLALAVWLWFPSVAELIIVRGLGFKPPSQPPSLIWSTSLWFFFTWFTFFAIGLGGSFVVAAWMWREREKLEMERVYPMVSFVVPAFNEEKTIMRCINSLFECVIKYRGPSEIIVVDDGSTDYTYEVAWAAILLKQRESSRVRAKVVRHMTNLGKAEAIRTGVNKVMGEIVATVDADTFWNPNALTDLVDFMSATGMTAISGHIHPSNGDDKWNFYIVLQQLEYSQGLGILRQAQALGDAIPVVPGPMGLYRVEVLRDMLNERSTKSVTEDLELTLEMQKKKMKIGYNEEARSVTVAPTSFRLFWHQRLRWSIGWLHNMLGIHRDMLFNSGWLSLFLWYSLVDYLGVMIELGALLTMPLFFLFAPDRAFFVLNLLIFLLLVLVVGVTYQALALKFAYNSFNHKRLLLYTPFYYVLRLINVLARFTTIIQYTILGNRGTWHKTKT